METAIKERPLNAKAHEVRAILNDTKTQVRLVAKAFNELKNIDGVLKRFPNQQGCPYGEVGDRLWVRESFGFNHAAANAKDVLVYRADYEKGELVTSFKNERKVLRPWGETEYEETNHWYASTTMKRPDSRILLEIVSVRVERLQDISAADAIAEGIEKDGSAPFVDRILSPTYKCYTDPKGVVAFGNPVASYRSLWAKMNGLESWEANPWVWVVEFKRVA